MNKLIQTSLSLLIIIAILAVGFFSGYNYFLKETNQNLMINQNNQRVNEVINFINNNINKPAPVVENKILDLNK